MALLSDDEKTKINSSRNNQNQLFLRERSETEQSDTIKKVWGKFNV